MVATIIPVKLVRNVYSPNTLEFILETKKIFYIFSEHINKNPICRKRKKES